MPKRKGGGDAKVQLSIRMDGQIVNALEALATKAVYGGSVSEILNRLAADLVRKELAGGPLLTMKDLEGKG